MSLRTPLLAACVGLALAAPTSAQDGALVRAVSGPGVLPAAQAAPQGFEAPDLRQPLNKRVQATFTVTTADDTGPGSLREAILAANASPGLDAIAFAIGGGGAYREIIVRTLLPSLTDPVTIDGATQGCDTSEGLCIRLDGPDLRIDDATLDGAFVVLGGGSIIRGIVFTRFYAGEVGAAVSIGSSDNAVTGCYFGTDRTGAVTDPDGTPGSGDELGNGFGIGISSRYLGLPISGNVVGGLSSSARNVVSGSTYSGVSVAGMLTAATTVVGNHIGTDAAGTAGLGNGGVGVIIEDARGTVVAANLVSGNVSGGIKLQGGASETEVAGNRVGTDVTGTRALPNGTPAGLAVGRGFGVHVLSGADNEIYGNLLSGNLLAGVVLGTFATPNTVTGTVIRDNRMGTDISGTLPIPNGIPGVPDVGFGVVMFTPNGNTVTGTVIGGPDEDDANVMGFNTTAGVAGQGPGVAGNVIDNNYIGVTEDGLHPIPNGTAGVIFRDYVHGNRIGAFSAHGLEPGNVIGHHPLDIALGPSTFGNEVALNLFVGTPGTTRPIDLGADGPTANDPGDADEGPNRLQNTPLVEAVSATGDQPGSEVSVTFRVDTDPANAAYPLTVRFYGADNGYIGIGSVAYAAADAGEAVTATFTLPGEVPDGVLDGDLYATATDAAGNTSELSAVGSAVLAEAGPALAATHTLSAPFPNPTARSARFALTVSEGQRVAAGLFDVLGRRVATLLDARLAGGIPEAMVVDGAGLAGGTYVVRVVGERFRDTRRVTLVE